jgi:hypothetical protein
VRRNELLNGSPVVVGEQWFTLLLPPTGKLRFDFVSTIRPPAHATAATHRQAADVAPLNDEVLHTENKNNDNNNIFEAMRP